MNPMNKMARTHAAMSLVMILPLGLAACGPRRPAESVRTLEGTQAERVAVVRRLLARHTALPSPILNAQFLEEQTGDGRLGPSDFAAFYALTVAPGDVAAWRAILPAPEAGAPQIQYAAPKQARPWWVSPQDFARLEFYGPKPLTGSVNGWVGIAPDGRIFIYSFTL